MLETDMDTRGKITTHSLRRRLTSIKNIYYVMLLCLYIKYINIFQVLKAKPTKKKKLPLLLIYRHNAI